MGAHGESVETDEKLKGRERKGEGGRKEWGSGFGGKRAASGGKLEFERRESKFS